MLTYKFEYIELYLSTYKSRSMSQSSISSSHQKLDHFECDSCKKHSGVSSHYILLQPATRLYALF